jgi:hypothetical protein
LVFSSSRRLDGETIERALAGTRVAGVCLTSRRHTHGERQLLMLNDARFALRLLARSPAFGVVAILVIALGIGAATAVFTVVDGVLLRPLPYPDADRILVLGDARWNNRTDLGAVSPANFIDWQSQTQVLSDVAAARSMHWNLGAGDRAEWIAGAITCAQRARAASRRWVSR